MPVLGRTQWRWLALLAIALSVAQIRQPFPEFALLQHLPTLFALVAAPWLLRRWPVSDAALACIVSFLLLHTLGGRYAYSNVPYEQWFHAVTGGDLEYLTGWTRNHYDRLAHLGFGLLMVLPVVEIVRLRGVRLGLALWVAVSFVLAISCLYEIFEWLLTLVMAGPNADRYNGQQGDLWDPQKDMALVLLGAVIAALALVLRRGRIG